MAGYLTAEIKKQLRACAQIMERRDNKPVKLTKGGAIYTDIALRFLSAEVSRLSKGKLTVRYADEALFAKKVTFKGLIRYFAVCPSSLNGEITELTPNVTLYTLGWGDELRRF